MGLGEEDGQVPDAAWKKAKRNESWFPGDEVNLAIGQGDLLITPLQLANAYSAFVNNDLKTPIMLAGQPATDRGRLPAHARAARSPAPRPEARDERAAVPPPPPSPSRATATSPASRALPKTSAPSSTCCSSPCRRRTPPARSALSSSTTASPAQSKQGRSRATSCSSRSNKGRRHGRLTVGARVPRMAPTMARYGRDNPWERRKRG